MRAYYILTKINIHAQYLIYRLLNNIIHLKIIQFPALSHALSTINECFFRRNLV